MAGHCFCSRGYLVGKRQLAQVNSEGSLAELALSNASGNRAAAAGSLAEYEAEPAISLASRATLSRRSFIRNRSHVASVGNHSLEETVAKKAKKQTARERGREQDPGRLASGRTDEVTARHF